MKRWLWGLFAVWMTVSGIAWGQGGPPEKSMVTLTWADFVAITGFNPNQKAGQVITIPWSEVESLLGVKIERMGNSTSVELPWQEFKSLLQWSIKESAGKGQEVPPTDFVVGATALSGKLTEDGATLTLETSIDVLRADRWISIPVLPTTVAVTKSTLPDGVFLRTADSAYQLITHRTGALKVKIDFAAAVVKEQGLSTLRFQRVLPGSSVVDLSLERTDVELKISGAQTQVSKVSGTSTNVMGAIPNGMPVSISWERALPKVEKEPTKLYAETRTLVSVAEGVLLGQETVTFSILHTPVRELMLSVPSGVNLLTVGGRNVEDWRMESGGDLRVVLKSDALGTEMIHLTFERPATDRVDAPVIRARHVEREKGFVGVAALSNLELGALGVTGARVIEAHQLPPEVVAMTSQPILLAFRYVGESFSIPLTLKKHDEIGMVVTLVDTASFTSMQLNDGRRITRVIYTVRNNRSQFLRMTMPAGVEIWSTEVSGRAVSPAKDDKGRLLLPLVRSATGANELVSFPVELVYVEAPEKALPEQGTLKVVFPSLDVPVMQQMVDYYLPLEGKYGDEEDFSGPLRPVKGYASLMGMPGQQLAVVNAQEQAQLMQQMMDTRSDEETLAAGAQPIRVRLPLNGRLYRFEKILVLPGDMLWLSLPYRKWDVAD